MNARKSYAIHNKHQSYSLVINSNERTSENVIYLTARYEYIPVLPIRIVKERFQNKWDFSLSSGVYTKHNNKSCFAFL